MSVPYEVDGRSSYNRPARAQRVSRGIALLILNLDARRGR
jgi:hypothetical protein